MIGGNDANAAIYFISNAFQCNKYDGNLRGFKRGEKKKNGMFN